MKKITLIIGILVAANIALAQGGKRGPKGDRAEMRIETFKERLELTEDQVTDLEKLREDMKPEFEEIRKNESMEKADKMRAHADLLEKREAEVEKILNDEQLAEFEVIKKEAKDKRAERMEKRKQKRGDNK